MVKHLLDAAILLFSVAGVWAVLYTGVTNSLSISLHVSRTKVTKRWFGGIVLVATILAAVNFFGWLLPTYRAGLVSYIFFGLLVACFAIVALIPHVMHTRRGRVHNIAAWGMVWLVPLIMSVMLFWPLSALAWWLVAGLLLLDCILLFLALRFHKRFSPWFLYFQSAYLAIFFIALLVVTYC